MRRCLGTAVIALSLSAVAVAVAEGDEVEAGPEVDLFSRVPRRWVSGAADELPIRSPRLLRRLPEECHTRGGYRRLCQGERRVPEPHGPAAVLAERLALGHRATALQLRHGDAFEEWLEAAEGTDPNPRLLFPVEGGRLGRGFGHTRSGSLRSRMHWGIDIGAEEGTPIRASRGGLVVFSDDSLTGFGNAVMLLHEDDATTFYGHCLRTLVFPGQRVERGQHIADVGATGFPDNPHLHFEWREGGWARDPEPEIVHVRND